MPAQTLAQLCSAATKCYLSAIKREKKVQAGLRKLKALEAAYIAAADHEQALQGTTSSRHKLDDARTAVCGAERAVKAAYRMSFLFTYWQDPEKRMLANEIKDQVDAAKRARDDTEVGFAKAKRISSDKDTDEDSDE